MKRIFLVIITFFSFQAQARVFDFKNENLAAFFHITGGTSRLANTAFAQSNGSGITVDASVAYNYSFEMGFLYAVGEKVTMRLGAELVTARQVDGFAGETAGGVSYYSLTSTVHSFNPSVTFEINISNSAHSRLFVYGGAGMGSITMDNAYAFTAAGITNLPVTADYTEKSEANVISSTVGIGYEMLAVDNVTFAVNMGYRGLSSREMKYKTDLAELVEISAPVAKGDIVKNNDGSNRPIDLGGYYIGMGFRFYINFL